MPNENSNEKFMSFTYLNAITGADAAQMEQKAAELGMLVDAQQGKFIARSNLPKFFDAYFEGKHYERTYKIPGWLSGNTEPWCKTLTDMYSSPITRPTSLSPQQGEFLRSLIVNTSPQSVVETGTYIGVSSIWIGSALKDADRGGHLHSVDLHADILPMSNGARTYCILDPMPMVQERIDQAELTDKITLIKGNSHAVGSKWNQYNDKPIDILYIDGDHTIEGCMADFKAFQPFMAENSFIIFHDIFPRYCGWEGPRFFLDNLARIAGTGHQAFELETAPHNFGMAVVRVKKISTPRPHLTR